jgi:hypothetical protein
MKHFSEEVFLIVAAPHQLCMQAAAKYNPLIGRRGFNDSHTAIAKRGEAVTSAA